SVLIIPSFGIEPIDTVLELRGRLLELSRYGIILVEPKEGPVSPRETLQENLRRMRENRTTPKGNSYFKCGALGHCKRDSPKLKNKNEGSVNAQGWVSRPRSSSTVSIGSIPNEGIIRTLQDLADKGFIRPSSSPWGALIVLKKKMTDEYCPLGEVKKLEIELWNLKVRDNNIPAYTNRFQELALICTKFVSNETEKVDKYINGLPDNIYGKVKSSKPKMLDETIELANDLIDQKLRTYAERKSDRHFKRDCPKLKNNDEESVNVRGWVYAVGNAEKKGNSSRDPNFNVITGSERKDMPAKSLEESRPSKKVLFNDYHPDQPITIEGSLSAECRSKLIKAMYRQPMLSHGLGCT
nr:hypothetical protein [Tanacetum cinerariifolium]